MNSVSKYTFLLHLFLIAASSVGQTIIKGKVLRNRKGLRNVEVTSQTNANLFLAAKTNGEGNFEVESSGIGDQIVFRKKGYISQSVTIANNQPLMINLQKKPRKRIRYLTIRRKGGCPPSNPLCGCCFYGGTKILLSDGSQKNIEALRVGDLIINVDLRSFQTQIDTVRSVDSVYHEDLLRFVFEDGSTVISTEDHPYLVEGKGWCSFRSHLTRKNYGIQAMDLKPGDRCFLYSEHSLKPLVIKSIQKTALSGMTYNISGL